MEDSDWIRENYEALSEKFGGEFIAVFNGRVIAHGPRYGKVESVAEKMAKKRLIAYVERGDDVYGATSLQNI